MLLDDDVTLRKQLLLFDGIAGPGNLIFAVSTT